MRPRPMEIDDLLKEAANWRPGTEMPAGLERQALTRCGRPPLRPIGIARPRSILFATVLAGVCCTLMVVHVEQKPTAPRPSLGTSEETPKPTAARQDFPDQKIPPRASLTPKKIVLKGVPEPSALPNKSVPARFTQRARKPSAPERIAVASEDSVVAQSRVAVEATAYTPAYYAEPSADGQSVQYTPVSVALTDPDVIYSESQQEN